MSRMMAGALLVLSVTGILRANDVDQVRPGHKPFYTPKAPLPTGVFAANSCFGYHATRWTPWFGACTNPETPMGKAPGCNNKAIILFEEPASKTTPPPPAAMVPAPESSKPMPQPKK